MITGLDSTCSSPQSVCNKKNYIHDVTLKAWQLQNICNVSIYMNVEGESLLQDMAISFIAFQFNGRSLLKRNVLINRRYLSLASLLLPMTVNMTLSQ